MFVIVLLFLDNIFGISFYYSTKLKIEQLQAINELRPNNDNDPRLIALLDQTENEIIERKNALQVFIGLFSEEQIDTKQEQTPVADTVFITQYDTVYVDKSNGKIEQPSKL